MRLNVKVGIEYTLSLKLTEEELETLKKNRKIVEDKIRELVYNTTGQDCDGDIGFQKVRVKICQNELTDL